MRNSMRLRAVLAAAALAACLSGCDALFGGDKAVADTTFAISGTVVNVRAVAQTSLPTAGTVEVRRFGATTAVASAAIASDGTYKVAGLESGQYLVTFKDAAATPTWFGIPVSVQVMGGDVSGLGALAYSGAPEGSILLVTTWSNKSYDIDSHSMIGPSGSASAVNYQSPSLSSGGNVVALERDITAERIAAGYYPAETTLVTSLASGTELRFYAKCYTATGSVSGLDDGDASVQPAGVQVYAMYQKSATEATHFGTWTAPLNTSESVVGMARVVGNDDGSLTVGSFGMDFTNTASATVKAIGAASGTGQVVAEIK